MYVYVHISVAYKVCVCIYTNEARTHIYLIGFSVCVREALLFWCTNSPQRRKPENRTRTINIDSHRQHNHYNYFCYTHERHDIAQHIQTHIAQYATRKQQAAHTRNDIFSARNDDIDDDGKCASTTRMRTEKQQQYASASVVRVVSVLMNSTRANIAWIGEFDTHDSEMKKKNTVYVTRKLYSIRNYIPHSLRRMSTSSMD